MVNSASAAPPLGLVDPNVVVLPPSLIRARHVTSRVSPTSCCVPPPTHAARTDAPTSPAPTPPYGARVHLRDAQRDALAPAATAHRHTCTGIGIASEARIKSTSTRTGIACSSTAAEDEAAASTAKRTALEADRPRRAALRFLARQLNHRGTKEVESRQWRQLCAAHAPMD